MPNYTYRCLSCFSEVSEYWTFPEHDALRDSPPHCDQCHTPMAPVISSPAFHRSTGEHFNPSLGHHVSSAREINNERSRLGAEMSERMGFDVDYEAVDPRDTDAVGIDVHDPEIGAALESQARGEVDRGEKDVKRYV